MLDKGGEGGWEEVRGSRIVPQMFVLQVWGREQLESWRSVSHKLLLAQSPDWSGDATLALALALAPSE